APGHHVAPVPHPIRRPGGPHRRRHPDRAVVGYVTPAAVSVEILPTHHFRRHVAGRYVWFVVPPVALGTPPVPIVGGALVLDVVNGRVGAQEDADLAGMDGHLGALGGRLRIPTPHRDR